MPLLTTPFSARKHSLAMQPCLVHYLHAVFPSCCDARNPRIRLLASTPTRPALPSRWRDHSNLGPRPTLLPSLRLVIRLLRAFLRVSTRGNRIVPNLSYTSLIVSAVYGLTRLVAQSSQLSNSRTIAFLSSCSLTSALSSSSKKIHPTFLPTTSLKGSRELNIVPGPHGIKAQAVLAVSLACSVLWVSPSAAFTKALRIHSGVICARCFLIPGSATCRPFQSTGPRPVLH